MQQSPAKEETSRPLYEQIGMGERQIELIAGATPKRHYYVVSPEGRRMIDLNLGPVALAFVGASGKEDIEAIKRLSALHGADWPGHWLKEKGFHVDLEPTNHGVVDRPVFVS